MRSKTLKTLEYDKILSFIESFADSSFACEKIRETKIFNDLALANEELDKVKEAFDLMYLHSVMPNFSMDNIKNIISRAQVYSTLSMGDLLKVKNVLRVSRQVKTLITSVTNEEIVKLKDIAFDIYLDKKLEDDINDAVLSDSELKDTASDTLFNLRKSIKRLGDNIKKKLRSYITSPHLKNALQDNIVTIRNDRYVIPVKSEQRSNVKGLIHDQSSSGQTIFVEPMEIVEMNNELKTLFINESNEIERILQAFTARIAAITQMLTLSYDLISDLDVIFAKAKYASSIKAVRPLLNDKGYINIRDGRHPLIDAKSVVSNSIEIGKDNSLLLITGPNTGGKTVCLKLVGLFQLMALSGIFLPAKESHCSVFSNIFCDIGDEQSIEQSLSTFSSHMTNIISIIDNISKDSLILLDELGAGTDPTEGASLAISISDFILQSGAKALITTHYNELKEYAIATKGVENASMDFELKTYNPTFKLLIGTPGSSNALIIAEKLGLHPTIIDKAKQGIKSQKVDFENVIKELEIAKKAAIVAKEEAIENLKKTEQALRDVQNEKNLLMLKREKLNEAIRKDKKELIRDTAEEVEEIIQELKDILNNPSDEGLFKAHKIKKSLNDRLTDNEENEFVGVSDLLDGPILEGDCVYVKALNAKGKVVDANERKNEVKVNLNGITSNLKYSDVVKVEKTHQQSKKNTIVQPIKTEKVNSELNIIGRNIDEGLHELQAFIDKALLNNLGEISIIHGVGTGKLRNAVQKYLKSISNVAEFRDGIYGEGERGVTIVKLK